MPAADCLESLIGLAAGPVPCFPFPTDEAQQTAITTSVTGLYLADVEGLPIRPANSTQTGPRDFYDRLAQARRTGVATLRSALTKGLAGIFTEAPGWQGQLGSTSFTGTGSGNARLLLYTQQKPGQVLRITSVGVLTDQAITDLTLTVDGVAQPQLLVSNQGGQTLSEQLSIPLDGQTHTLEVVLPDGVRPRISKVCCQGCGGCGILETFLRGTDNGQRVDWLSYGISISASVQCLPGAKDVLCYASAEDENGSRFPEIRTILAQAVWYASAEKYCIGLLTDTAEGSRYTAFTPEALTNQITMYAKLVDQHVTWLVSRQALAGMKHPCYLCQGGIGLSIRKSY